jgi:HSP20 family protein
LSFSVSNAIFNFEAQKLKTMGILTKSPARSLKPGGYQSILDRMFRDGIRDYLFDEFQDTMPAVNISEEKDHFLIEMAAPGLKKEDFKIHADDDVLTISAEKEDVKKEEGKKFSRREYNYNSFTRSFTLNNMADINKIEAKYDAGVLKLTIPKKEISNPTQRKQIPVS